MDWTIDDINHTYLECIWIGKQLALGPELLAIFEQ